MNVNRDAHLIETTGLLDAVLTGENAGEFDRDDLKHVARTLDRIDQTALKEGRSVRINGDLVTISLDAYKQLSADAERGRWRISTEEPPPLEDRIHCKDANGFVSTRRIALCDLPYIVAWRPLD